MSKKKEIASDYYGRMILPQLLEVSETTKTLNYSIHMGKNIHEEILEDMKNGETTLLGSCNGLTTFMGLMVIVDKEDVDRLDVL